MIKYVFHSLQAVDPVFKRDLDAKDLDGAHMLYEGAWKLDDSREWAFELPGATVDVDNALNAMRAPSEGKVLGCLNSRPLRELDRLINTEGSRNDSCYDYALYCIANSKTWEEAESNAQKVNVKSVNLTNGRLVRRFSKEANQIKSRNYNLYSEDDFSTWQEDLRSDLK